MAYKQSMTWRNRTTTIIEVTDNEQIVVTDTSERLEGGSNTSRYTASEAIALAAEHDTLSYILRRAAEHLT